MAGMDTSRSGSDSVWSYTKQSRHNDVWRVPISEAVPWQCVHDSQTHKKWAEWFSQQKKEHNWAQFGGEQGQIEGQHYSENSTFFLN